MDGCLTKVLHWGAFGLLSVGRGWLPGPGFALGCLWVALGDEGVEQLCNAMLCYAMFNREVVVVTVVVAIVTVVLTSCP